MLINVVFVTLKAISFFKSSNIHKAIQLKLPTSIPEIEMKKRESNTKYVTVTE